MLTHQIRSTSAAWPTRRPFQLTESLDAMEMFKTIVSLFHHATCRPRFLIFLEVLVAALLKGADDGMDILTLSLGGADGWTEGTSTVIASKIAASGKIVTIAAGNDVGHYPFGGFSDCADVFN